MPNLVSNAAKEQPASIIEQTEGDVPDVASALAIGLGYGFVMRRGEKWSGAQFVLR